MPPKRKAATRSKKSKEEVDEVEDEEEEEAPPPKKNRTSSAKEEEGFENWKEHESLVYFNDPSVSGAKKIIGFDMDATLILPKGGKFPKNRSDWKWWHESVPKKLKSLVSEGFRVVIFSNQAGVEKGKQNVDHLKGKILDLQKELGVPLSAFLACATDHFRKPNTTMWDFFAKNCNSGVELDLSLCKYVGDAAGRPKEWKKGLKADIHAGDRAFAFNCQVTFETPEEFFLQESPHPDFDWGSLDPEQFLTSFAKNKHPLFEDKKDEPIHSSKQELVLMVGCPASGKSTFSKKYFVPNGYVHVNQDTLKNKAKCLKVAAAALSEGKSVVVDNTNGNADTRAEFLDLAKEHKIPARCFIMQTPLEVAHHLNFVREKLTEGEVRRIPDVGYNTFKSKYSEPALSEGFEQIRKVNFVPSFENENHKIYFLQRTSDS